MLIIYLILLISFFIFSTYIYLTRKFKYWTQLNVKGPKPKIIIGTFPKRILKNLNLIYDHNDIYRKFKLTERFVGVFTIREPELMILCPSLIRDILTKYFRNFHDNAIGHWINHSKEKIIGRNPFLLTNDTWKEVRSQLTPCLTINKIKSWYTITELTCEKLTNYIKYHNDNKDRNGDFIFNGRDLALRFTVELTTNTIFGIESKSLNPLENSKDNFIMKANNKFVDEFVDGFHFLSYANKIPFLNKFYAKRILSKSTEKFFKNLLKDSIALRLTTKINRNDFLDSLIQLKENKNLQLDELVAHTLAFTLDGYDTTAIVISHCLLLLGRNKHAQIKLRLEIMNNLNADGKLPFEKLVGMQYLDQCINETLRIFPPIAFSLKQCTEPLILENLDGKRIQIEKGQTVHLPFYSIYHDSNIYHDPEQFIPERFNLELGGVKRFRDEGLFFPFGDGPRICPGMKYGLIQSKAAVAEIIMNFSIDVDRRTRKDNLIGSVSLAALLQGKIWLKLRNLHC